MVFPSLPMKSRKGLAPSHKVNCNVHVCTTCQPCSWPRMHRKSHTKWQHSRPCFHHYEKLSWLIYWLLSLYLIPFCFVWLMILLSLVPFKNYKVNVWTGSIYLIPFCFVWLMILLSLVPFKNYKVNVWRGSINNLSFWGLKNSNHNCLYFYF